MKTTGFQNKVVRYASAILLAAFATAAHAIPFQVNSQLKGDSRPDSPDNLVVDVTIVGDDTSNQVFWTVDINSILHPSVKLHEFYFNVTGSASNYSFSGFSPIGWSISSPASIVGAGQGNGPTFLFEALDPNGPPNAPDVTNSVNLSFTMTNAFGAFNADMFLEAADVVLAAGTGQLGAHLQSLGPNGQGSGFAVGSYNVDVKNPPSEIPEPASIALLGMGLLGFAAARRKSRKCQKV